MYFCFGDFKHGSNTLIISKIISTALSFRFRFRLMVFFLFVFFGSIMLKIVVDDHLNKELFNEEIV